MIFMNTENSETSEPRNLVLNLSQKPDLSSSHKYFTFQNSSITH